MSIRRPSPSAAIGLETSRGSIVDNELAHGRIAIRLMDSRIEVHDNRAPRFGRSGIVVDGPRSANVITGNDFRGAQGIDCVDRTAGDGTAGTANSWRSNLGIEATPHGICRPRV